MRPGVSRVRRGSCIRARISALIAAMRSHLLAAAAVCCRACELRRRTAGKCAGGQSRGRSRRDRSSSAARDRRSIGMGRGHRCGVRGIEDHREPRERLRGDRRDRAGIRISRRSRDSRSGHHRLARNRQARRACRRARGHRARCARARLPERAQLPRSHRTRAHGKGALRHLRGLHRLGAPRPHALRELESDPHARADAGERGLRRALRAVDAVSVSGQGEHRR